MKSIKNLGGIITGIVLIIIAVVCRTLYINEIEESNKNIVEINNIIEDDKNTEKRAMLKILEKPTKLSEYGEDHGAYFWAWDETYYYVIYMTDEKYNQLEKSEDGLYIIDGITSIPSKEAKEYIIELWNKTPYIDENGEQQETREIDVNDYNSVFGKLYLDTTTNISGKASLLDGLFLIFLTFGVIIIFIEIVKIIVSIIIDKKEEKEKEKNKEEERA